MEQADNKKWIDLRHVLLQKAPSLAGIMPAFLINYLIRIVHQDELNEILNRYKDKDGVAFMQELIHYFDLTLELVNAENIPEDNGGRYLFASNHPLGGLDGICLSAVLGERFYGKIKYPVNDLLLFIPNLRSIFVPINKHGRQGREAAIQMEETYASDNQVITFPAGLCSRKQKGQIRDLDWKKSFIQKAVVHQRDIVPVYFEGRNSDFFYRLANLRKRLGIRVNLEMIYLSDEMFRSKHKTFRIYFGRPIPWQSFDKSRKPEEWAEWVKDKVYKLSKG
ncbi:1-acyl-sn-glycerol-3-phosphate acyltransferase [Parabacteroides sp. Marseille-P3160]|mgnify:CR=1 FL=1|uniref:1-acyl-sn-glycerol-3-phosphate acyltransferase n=1 Tax=Parabacteroides sp. Marseille-P3160 TaxID=1917887 RepID=UPI0009BC31FA|nr:1-acyl-sn-glycerol-3-phosphate acyltransferase [Parabacteroides sp. Marseille-P3160]